jgi:hypothetical protein
VYIRALQLIQILNIPFWPLVHIHACYVKSFISEHMVEHKKNTMPDLVWQKQNKNVVVIFSN